MWIVPTALVVMFVFIVYLLCFDARDVDEAVTTVKQKTVKAKEVVADKAIAAKKQALTEGDEKTTIK